MTERPSEREWRRWDRLTSATFELNRAKVIAGCRHYEQITQLVDAIDELRDDVEFQTRAMQLAERDEP